MTSCIEEFRQGLAEHGEPSLGSRSEPADVLFLQYCAGVLPAVRSTMRAYALERQKRFCILNGYSSLRPLRAYNKCGFGSKPMKPRALSSEVVEPEDDAADDEPD